MTDQPFTCIIFKVCLSGSFGMELFATKDRYCSPQNVKEDVSKRYPNMRYRTFRVFYYGMLCLIDVFMHLMIVVHTFFVDESSMMTLWLYDLFVASISDHGGERVSLRNPSDFDIFYELNIEKLYMATDNHPFITKKTCSICGQCKKNGVNGSSVRSRFKKLCMLKEIRIAFPSNLVNCN